MKKSPELNIVVPVFNRPDMTLKTIQSVKEHLKCEYVLTAVDNGSDPETKHLLQNLKDDGCIDHLIRLEKNFGVAVAANVGWRLVEAPLYMKLDNDVVIHSFQWINLVKKLMMSHRSASVWGADLNGQLCSPRFVKENLGFYGKTSAHVSGGAIIIPQNIAEAVGYWCEDYGLYGCEDGDYGERLRKMSVDQFYFDHIPYMKHIGKDADLLKSEYGLDKKREKMFFVSLWKTNCFLYAGDFRAPNVPAQFVPVSYDGYILKLAKNREYYDMFAALVGFHKARVEQEEFSKPFIDALNHFVTVQNETWKKATEFAERRYAAIRRKHFGSFA